MKKIIAVLFILFVLSGCGKNISVDDLKANDWLIESSDDSNMILHFTDKQVSFSIDTASIKSTASNEWEKYGEDLGKEMIDQLSFDVNYTLKNNVITWEKEGDKSKYSIKKDKKNLVFTPDKSNDSKDKLVLKPYLNKKKVSQTKTSTTSSTSTTSTEQSSSSSEEVSISLNDFVGGWGVPNSGNLFFINADNTMTNSTAETLPISDITFQSLPDKSVKMAFTLNGSPTEMIKNNDGTVTAGGQVYEFLGNLTMEQFLAQKNTENNSGNLPSNDESEISTEIPQVQTATVYNDDKEKQAEISQYFNQQKSTFISKKREQIATWKANGEVNWSDEIVNNAMNEFISYLGEETYYTSQVNSSSIQEVKNSIDKTFQHAYDTMIQK